MSVDGKALSECRVLAAAVGGIASISVICFAVPGTAADRDLASNQTALPVPQVRVASSTQVTLPMPRLLANAGDLQRRYETAVRMILSQACDYSEVAQVSPQQSDLQRQYDAAFEEMLNKPGDVDVLFRFAALAAQTGDLEGAISALERMLIANPQLTRIRLELGILYYRLGSYQVARTYVETVLKTAGLPADFQSKAQQVIAEIEGKQSPSHFSGEFFVGWRYQSNANFGPATPNVTLFGQVASLNQSSVATPDWGVVSSLQLRHSYDLGGPDKSAIETTLVAYGSRQFQLSTTNVSLLDFTTGPRFQVFADIFSDVTMRPFIAAGGIWVNDTPYYGSYGGGLEIGVLLLDQLRNNTTLSWRRRDYPNTWYLPTNSLYRGNEYSAATNFQYQLTPAVALLATGIGQRYETAVAPWLSYQTGGLGGGVAFRFEDPVFATTLPWTVSLTGAHQWWFYDAPDIQVDPTMIRTQDDWVLNMAISIPFDQRTTFTISGGRLIRSSNLPNYVFDNNSVMFGVSWRF